MTISGPIGVSEILRTTSHKGLQGAVSLALRIQSFRRQGGIEPRRCHSIAQYNERSKPLGEGSRAVGSVYLAVYAYNAPSHSVLFTYEACRYTVTCIYVCVRVGVRVRVGAICVCVGGSGILCFWTVSSTIKNIARLHIHMGWGRKLGMEVRVRDGGIWLWYTYRRSNYRT
jgi:hypothetical protein